MLLVVVLLFAIFWLPLQTFSMVTFLYPSIYYDYDSLGYTIFIGTYFACHWLSMAHSCLNPLVYCFMNDQFRSDLNALVCGLLRGAERRLTIAASKTNSAPTTTTNQQKQIERQLSRSASLLAAGPKLSSAPGCARPLSVAERQRLESSASLAKGRRLSWASSQRQQPQPQPQPQPQATGSRRARHKSRGGRPSSTSSSAATSV